MPESSRSTFAQYVGSHPKLAIFLGAFILRFILILIWGDAIPPSPDKAHRYDLIARSLIQGEGFSMKGKLTAYGAPLYPYVLAALYSLFGYSLKLVRIFLCFVDAGNCVLFYLIAKKYFNDRVPILTALALIASPFAIYSIFLATTEVPFLFLNSLFILSLTTALQNDSSRKYFGSGVILGFTTLCRAQPLLLPIFLAPTFVIRFQNRLKSAIGGWALLMIGFVLVLSPWTVRNYVVFGKFIPVQTLGGLHLYKSSPLQNREEEVRQAEEMTKKMNALQKDEFYYKYAWEKIRNNPGSYVRAWGRRLIKMWYKTDSGRYEDILKVVNGLLLILASFGMLLTRKRWKRFVLLYSMIVYVVLINMVLGALVRYVLPVLPILTLFAMVSINRLLNLNRQDARNAKRKK